MATKQQYKDIIDRYFDFPDLIYTANSYIDKTIGHFESGVVINKDAIDRGELYKQRQKLSDILSTLQKIKEYCSERYDQILAEEEAARKAAQEEAARKAAQEEAARKAAQEAAKQQSTQKNTSGSSAKQQSNQGKNLIKPVPRNYVRR